MPDPLTIAQVRALYETPSRLRHKADVDRALAMLLARLEKETKRRRGPSHRVGEVWHHKDEASGAIIYQPMWITEVHHRFFMMSDGERWTVGELREAGWAPRKGGGKR